MTRLVIALIMALSACSLAHADNDRTAVADYNTNFNTPVLSKKALTPVRVHMGSIGNALAKKKFKTDMVRKGEVVRVEIPCSDFFAPNDTSLNERAKTTLAEFKPILQSPTMYKIIVAVYTDNTGDDTYADDITWSRAAAIYDFLSSCADVKDANVIPYGMGHDSSKSPNNSIKNRAKNRRIEILIVPEWNLIKDAASGKLGK